jgi:Na+-translocating ferredoxin:NAD+ oxidoreductase subunit C
MAETAASSIESVPVPSPFRPMPGIAAAVAANRNSQPLDTDLFNWRERLIAAGVNANRVASPDLIGQLTHAGKTDIDTIICCVLDTDPSVAFNSIIAETFTNELAAGISLLAKLTAAKNIWITADPGRSSEWFVSLEATIQNPGLRLVPLRGDYPQTDPTLMLHTLLQRRLLPGRLPTEKGTILLDAAAAVMVGRCVLYEPPVRVIELAIRDHFQQKTHLLSAPMGIRLGDICEFLEIGHPEALFRAGDFLRDQWITRETVLGHGELVIHPTAKHLDANPDPCIHCGWCLEACPMRIHPAGLLDAAQKNDRRTGKKFGLEACIECGICSYVCPTRLPLLSAIRRLKS